MCCPKGGGLASRPIHPSRSAFVKKFIIKTFYSSITFQHSTWHWLVFSDSARGQLDKNRSTPGHDLTPVSTVLRKLVWFFIINIFLIKRKLSKLKSAWKMLDSRCLISTTIWKLSLITLRSKRFQSRYRANVRANPPPPVPPDEFARKRLLRRLDLDEIIRRLSGFVWGEWKWPISRNPEKGTLGMAGVIIHENSGVTRVSVILFSPTILDEFYSFKTICFFSLLSPTQFQISKKYSLTWDSI